MQGENIKYKKDSMVGTKSDYICKDSYRIIGWFLLIIAILFIICNTNDVIKCVTFPDKVVFDMIYNYLPTN